MNLSIDQTLFMWMSFNHSLFRTHSKQVIPLLLIVSIDFSSLVKNGFDRLLWRASISLRFFDVLYINCELNLFHYLDAFHNRRIQNLWKICVFKSITVLRLPKSFLSEHWSVEYINNRKKFNLYYHVWFVKLIRCSIRNIQAQWENLTPSQCPLIQPVK